MSVLHRSVWCPIILALAATSASAIDLDQATVLDLSHPFNSQTLYWPTSPSQFELKTLAHGQTDGGFFYSSNSFCSPEHGGTHLDAPIHFAEHGKTADQLDLAQLIGPAVVIDVREQVAKNPDYALTADDITAFEANHGKLAAGTIVLLQTGYSKHYPNRKAYFGDDTPNDASKLHFPSYGPDAATLLVDKRHVAVLGVDTASIDIGQSKDFQVHRIAAAKNVAGLENLNGLDRLPPVGASVVALPMKIEGGSGGPVRVIALLPPK
ncbi:cyclase [Ahniella affigens]|uniref:Cyclase n=1 Tax=Ahniella affigens TaxID=2021234 RepID=A0A2P1PX55_9GAMM|nr:cyclase family protein [Ahniella affigens]AVP99429.1 cyclase [Ahniella affigens]